MYLNESNFIETSMPLATSISSIWNWAEHVCI